MSSLYLASATPRRRKLLLQIGVPHRRIDAPIDESVLPDETPVAYVERLARAKAAAGLVALEGTHACVLGADTAVVLDGRILGKPQDRGDGLAMLAALSGRSHQVLTAVAVSDGTRCEARVVSSRVHFRALAEQTNRFASLLTSLGVGRGVGRRLIEADVARHAAAQESS